MPLPVEEANVVAFARAGFFSTRPRSSVAVQRAFSIKLGGASWAKDRLAKSSAIRASNKNLNSLYLPLGIKGWQVNWQSEGITGPST
jgi:hypothetical protein